MNDRKTTLLVMTIVFGLLKSYPAVFGQGATDEWLRTPIDNKTFETFLDFFAYDRELPYATQSLGARESDGIERERLSFQCGPTARITADFYNPVGSLEKAPALILVHGGMGKGKNSPLIEVRAEFLARAGFTVLAIDLQHFGDRRTSLLTQFTEKEKHQRLYNQPSVYLAWIVQSVKDIRRSFDFLVEERGAHPGRIGLYGVSRGAQVASIAGAVETRFVAVALIHGGHFDALELKHRRPACPANYIGRISPRPLLMLNGISDGDYNRDSSVLPLFNLARNPKNIIWVDGGHMSYTEEALAEVVSWLNSHLRE